MPWRRGSRPRHPVDPLHEVLQGSTRSVWPWYSRVLERVSCTPKRKTRGARCRRSILQLCRQSCCPSMHHHPNFPRTDPSTRSQGPAGHFTAKAPRSSSSCRLPDYADFFFVDSCRRAPSEFRCRHNQRASRKAKSSSSGRYRPGSTPTGVVRASACSFKRRSAWR